MHDVIQHAIQNSKHEPHPAGPHTEQARRYPYGCLTLTHPALSRAARYARDFGGARLNLSYSAAADSEAIEFSQSYSQAKPHLCTCVRTQFCCATSSISAPPLAGMPSPYQPCRATPAPPYHPYHPYTSRTTRTPGP